MRVILYDTETNGLPKRWNAPPTDVANWPAILTIAWQIWDYSAEPPVLLEKEMRLVDPGPSIVWDEEAAKIHGLSLEIARTEGQAPVQVFTEFMEKVRTCDLVVAHNLAFDKSVVLASLYRLNPSMRVDWWPRMEYCTCLNTAMLCKLPPVCKNPKPSDPYKRPRLPELYNYLFEKQPDAAVLHSAAGDTAVLSDCFLELVRRRVVPLERWAAAARRV